MTLRHQLLRLVVAVLAAGGLLYGLLLLGQFARGRLDAVGHYDVALADFQCAAPPGLTRGEFLDEVQYLGGLPGTMNALDKPTAVRLAAAFSWHPWVERVQAIQWRPPSAVLVFRTPVLAVGGRVIDGNGILMPLNASSEGLPQLTVAAAPAGEAGRPWGNAEVEDAARATAALGPWIQSLAVTRVELSPDGPVFVGRTRVRWGRGDAAANVAKLKAALDAPKGVATEIDLR